MSHLHDLHTMSLEKIACEAHISTASVSRFISKAGFTSFRDFKYYFGQFNKDVKMNRLVSHVKRFTKSTAEDISDSLYEDAINNLKQTKIKLNLEKLKSVCRQLKKSRKVIILGDSHELDDFYTLQLDLIIHNIPAYLVNFNEMNKFASHMLDKNDTVLYIDVCHRWFDGLKKELLQRAKNRRTTIIIFAQEDSHIADYADMLCLYGVNESSNDGYYSLPYISRLLSELIYQN